MTFRHLTKIAGNVVDVTQRRLPSPVRDLALRVPVCFEPHPNDDILAEGWNLIFLGYLSALPTAPIREIPKPLPSQILLFLENIWDYAEGDESGLSG